MSMGDVDDTEPSVSQPCFSVYVYTSVIWPSVT